MSLLRRSPTAVRCVYRRCFAQVPSTRRVKPSLDFKAMRSRRDELVANAAARAAACDVDGALAAYKEHVEVEEQCRQLRQDRKRIAGSGEAARLQGQQLRAELTALEAHSKQLQRDMVDLALAIPNDTHPASPVGDDNAAVVVRTVGTMPHFDFPPVSHVDLGAKHNVLDLRRSAGVAGAKFATLKNEAALLELELASWAMRQLRQRGFQLHLPPDVAHQDLVAACGFQARGEHSQVYAVADSELCLIGTSEVPLAAWHMDSVLPAEALPLRLAAFSHCFRREAGAAGKQDAGLYRLHQFSKVEMFVLCQPEDSDRHLQELVDIQTELVEQLGLHARVLNMPTQEMGASAYQKFDVEAWMPSREGFGEVCSATNCTDYQSRRLGIRFKRANSRKNKFVHTLNATALAVPRTILAMIEAGQGEDGSVTFPPPFEHLSMA